MHPKSCFRWNDRAAMRALVEEVGLGMLFAMTPEGPRVAQLPVVWDGDTLLFHLARGNALTPHLDGATAVFTVTGPHAYVSPDWYGLDAGQVPTWNYLAVELEGSVRTLDRDALVAQIDALATVEEARLAPKPAWTRAKMDAELFEGMLRGIAGFALTIEQWRGTRKLGQNKPAHARLAAADALAVRSPALAEAMRQVP
jgi:transcriptional regulator